MTHLETTSTTREPDAEESALGGPFRAGDRVQLTGPKGRVSTVFLVPGERFHMHRGAIEHDAIIGLEEGSVIRANDGSEFLLLRPLLRDVVMSMPRGAAIIYPKDAAQILAKADIRPGARIVEAGLGSGALALWLLRALAGTGRLFSFERRQEFADVAEGNVVSVLGERPGNWSIELGDLADALPLAVADGTADRCILDMLAPWEVLGQVANALKPGGVLICYVATVTQLSRVAEAIRATECFTDPDADETIVRGWHVEGLAVRPDHRMIGHTAFLLTARRLAPGTKPPVLKRRASKTEFSDEDVEVWTPGSLGDRQVSDKVLRKRARKAQRGATIATADRDDRDDRDEVEQAPTAGLDEAPETAE